MVCFQSNGAKNRIHVSEETANLLRAAGKSRWVKKREDKIIAKGKGKLQTYWVDTKSVASTCSVAHTLSTSMSGSAGFGLEDAVDYGDIPHDSQLNYSFTISNDDSDVEATPESLLDSKAVSTKSKCLKEELAPSLTKTKAVPESAVPGSMDDLSRKLHQRLAGSQREGPAHFL